MKRLCNGRNRARRERAETVRKGKSLQSEIDEKKLEEKNHITKCESKQRALWQTHQNGLFPFVAFAPEFLLCTSKKSHVSAHRQSLLWAARSHLVAPSVRMALAVGSMAIRPVPADVRNRRCRTFYYTRKHGEHDEWPFGRRDNFFFLTFDEFVCSSRCSAEKLCNFLLAAQR